MFTASTHKLDVLFFIVVMEIIVMVTDSGRQLLKFLNYIHTNTKILRQTQTNTLIHTHIHIYIYII